MNAHKEGKLKEAERLYRAILQSQPLHPDANHNLGLIAHGGSLAMSASMLALLDYSDAVSSKTIVDPSKSKRKVLGIDIDIRARNRLAIERHPMSHLIQMIQGSSIAPEIVQQVPHPKNFVT